jgi:homoserine/homoserine lactone efflux protein
VNEGLFLGFLAATFAIMVTPGPSVALATSQAMRYGMRIAMITVAGDALGSAVHIVIATIGFHFLIEAAASVLPWVQVAGGAYILYLAYQSFRTVDEPDAGEGRSSTRAREAFVSGFLACVSNPKAIIFFAALFPGFIDPAYSVPLQSAVYGVIFISLDVFSIVCFVISTTFLLKSGFFKRINHSILSAIGLSLIGLFLVARGIFQIATA